MYTPPSQTSHLTRVIQDQLARDVRDTRRGRPDRPEPARPGPAPGIGALLRGLVARREVSR